MGTAEIYRAVLALDEVVDALVVELPAGRWRRLHAAVRRAAAGPRAAATALVDAIRTRIREDCSPRHVPDAIRQIEAVPRTLSGKVLEVPVKRILMGQDPDTAVSRDALANADALDYFVQLQRDGI